MTIKDAFTGPKVDGYEFSDSKLLPGEIEAIWARLIEPKLMKGWMPGVDRAEMRGGEIDAGSVGAEVILGGQVQKSGPWECVGRTLEAGRGRLVREYLLEQPFLPSKPRRTGPDGRPEYDYRREITHQLNAIGEGQTELVIEVKLSIPGFPERALGMAVRAEKKSLRLGLNRLERVLRGKRAKPLGWFSDAARTPACL